MDTISAEDINLIKILTYEPIKTELENHILLEPEFKKIDMLARKCRAMRVTKMLLKRLHPKGLCNKMIKKSRTAIIKKRDCHGRFIKSKQEFIPITQIQHSYHIPHTLN